MKKSSIIVFMACFIFALGLAAMVLANVSGKWEITTRSPRGERTRTIEIKQDGENIMEGRNGETMEAEGTIKGDQIEWSITRETPRGEFTMTYTGTVEGDSMSGEMEVGDFGSREWTATKVK